VSVVSFAPMSTVVVGTLDVDVTTSEVEGSGVAVVIDGEGAIVVGHTPHIAGQDVCKSCGAQSLGTKNEHSDRSSTPPQLPRGVAVGFDDVGDAVLSDGAVVGWPEEGGNVVDIEGEPLGAALGNEVHVLQSAGQI